MENLIFKNLAIKLAKQAGKTLLDNSENIKIIKFKDRQDIVTNIVTNMKRISRNAQKNS